MVNLRCKTKKGNFATDYEKEFMKGPTSPSPLTPAGVSGPRMISTLEGGCVPRDSKSPLIVKLGHTEHWKNWDRGHTLIKQWWCGQPWIRGWGKDHASRLSVFLLRSRNEKRDDSRSQNSTLFLFHKLGGLAFGQDVIYLAPWLELNFGFRTVSLDSRMIKAKCLRHLLSMFSFQNSWSPTAFSQKENMASLELFFYCRKRSVLPIGFGKVSFINSRSGGAYVEEAVEEHHHGTVQVPTHGGWIQLQGSWIFKFGLLFSFSVWRSGEDGASCSRAGPCSWEVYVLLRLELLKQELKYCQSRRIEEDR